MTVGRPRCYLMTLEGQLSVTDEPQNKAGVTDNVLRLTRERKAREKARKGQDAETIDDLALQGRYTRAILLLEERIVINDDDVHSRIKLADLLVQRKRETEALRHYLRAAELLSEDGFFDKALALLKSCRRISPKDSSIDALEERVLRSKELDMAAWSVRRGQGGDGTSQLAASIELEALWRRMGEGDFVQSLAPGQLEALMESMELVRVPAGEIVVSQYAEDTFELYLIASGLLQARLDPNGRDLLLRNFGPGQIIGEGVLFKQEPWPASYKAAHNSQLLRLGVKGLQRALKKTKSRRQLVHALSTQQNDVQVAAMARSAVTY